MDCVFVSPSLAPSLSSLSCGHNTHTHTHTHTHTQTDGFNCADLRNVCTEAGLFAIRAGRDYVLEEDFMKAARKIADTKKLESKLDYSKV